MAGNTVQITPFFAVRSLPQSIAFYRERLGFVPLVQMDTYAYLDREGAGLRILVHSDDDGPFSPRTCYIDVRDVDAIDRQCGGSWSDLPAGSVHGPVDQIYHQRELIISDPDGNRLIFGQGIGPNAAQWGSGKNG